MTTSDVPQLRMNVAALKRVDPYVKDILETATHVALYTFNGDNNEWERTDIEGALFVYSRIGEPYNSILIMNRLNTKNQVEPVTPGLDLQLQEPFLLYKNSKGNIYGIWFYDKDECVRISSMLNKLAKESDGTSKITSKNKKSVQKKASNVDIFSMLSKAQEDYNSNQSTGSTLNSSVDRPKSPMSNAIGELSGALSAMAMASDVTSKSVMDFFAKAQVNTGPQPQSGNVVNEGKPLLARLMSHPAAHTVEHIEKQQRSITPQPVVPPQQQSGMMISNQSNENSIITRLRNKMPTQSNANPSTQGHIFNQDYHKSSMKTPSCNAVSCSELSSELNKEDAMNSSSFLRIQSPTSVNSNNLTNHHKSNSNVSNFVESYESVQKQNCMSNNSHSFNSLRLESLFQHTSTTNVCDDLIAPALTPKSTSISTSGTGPALIPPGMFAAPSPAAVEPLHRPIEPLTRNQLLQAFNYLLHTDPDFVNKLHEAYVKSFSEILS